MCGIAGILDKKISERDLQVVEEMKAALKHRGPDDHGTAHDEHFVFGHQRLSIIDLEGGRQPMQTEDGRYTIVYNGEVYNYIELREELISKGAAFQTTSDTEVILRLIVDEGVKALKKFNGMFAFAVYDKKEKVLLAARDPFGIKPFYYTVTRKGKFIFASEIKAILLHPDVVAQTNRESLQEYLTFQFCLRNKTLFKEIYKLEPGCYMTFHFDQGPPRIKQYWNLNYQIDAHHTEEYFQDAILSTLKETARLQLRSDVEVGAYLSGGIDSSLVAMLASSTAGGKFQCFHGRFSEGADYDESEYARIVAEKIECRLKEVVPKARDFIEILPKLIYHMDEPAAGPGLFPQYMVSQLAAKNVKVVLGGTGGDEIFGGYARYYIAYLEQCLKGAIFETQEEGKHIVTLDKILPQLNILKQYVPMMKTFWEEGLFDSMDERYFRLIDRSHDLQHFLSPDVRRSWDSAKMFSEFKNIFHDPNTKSYLNKMTHFDQKTLLPALLQVEDRVSMACSLESRVPLLDTRLVDIVTRIPPAVKFQHGETKYILKQAVKGVLPLKVLKRKDKMGFPVPLKEWYEGPARDFIVDTLFSQKAKKRGLFDTKALKQVLEKERKYSRQVWGALCLELWFQQYGAAL